MNAEEESLIKAKGSLNVRVRYIASQKQFIDPSVDSSETLAQLKPKVLEFYGLVETNTKVYQFAYEGEVLPNLSVALESLAKGKHEIKLDLIERFEQG